MSEIPLTPLGREQIHKLESALLIGSILRPDVIEELKNPEERLTWVDSLAVAAAALAREKAKMTVRQIAEELGRTEATIRNHLQGKTKAGQIVRETYEKFLREGVKIELPSTIAEAKPSEEYVKKDEAEKMKKQYEEEVAKLKTQLEEEKKKVEELRGIIEKTRQTLTELLGSLP